MMIVIFDVVGTLFSLTRVRETFRAASVPEEFLPFWFARLLHVNMASALASRYVAFADAAESSLRQALAFRGLPLDVVPAALQAMRHLEPWEDARVCLETLRQAGHTVVALSNSSADTIRTLIDGAKLGALFESIVSADEVRRPKPDPTPYRRALERSGVPAASACFVAAHGWDIQGAAAVGLPTIWISRLEKAWSFPSGPPGRTVATLKEVPAMVTDIARTQAIGSR
jgi:2-haloacid dehalogenase